MRRAWAGLIVVGCLVGFATPAGAAKAPKGCLAALKAAETLQVGYELRNVNYATAVSEITTALTTNASFSAALNGTTTAVTKLGQELEAVQPGIDQSKDEYKAAAKKCRAGR